MPPSVTPIAGDPFAAAKTAGPKVVPVAGDPFAPPASKPAVPASKPAVPFSRPNLGAPAYDFKSMAGLPRTNLDSELAMTREQSQQARSARASILRTSPVAAAAHSAERGVLPALGGAAGFGAGFAAAGTLSSPLNAIPGWGSLANLGIATGGGLLGALGVGATTNYAQDKVLEALPSSVTTAIGQDPANRQLEEQEHPYATFLGGIAPSLLTMRPGFGSAAPVEEGASLLTRSLAHPAASHVIGATLSGAGEAAGEASQGHFDPVKIGIATAVGAGLNRPTALGDTLFRAGGNTAIRAMQAAGDAGWSARNAAADFAKAAQDRADIRAGRLIEGNATVVEPRKIGMPQEPAPAEPVATTSAPTPAAPAAPQTQLHIVPVAGNPFAGAPALPPPAEPTPPTPASAVAPAPPEGGPQPVAQASPAATGSDGLGKPPASPTAPSLRPDPGPVAEGERIVRTPAGSQVRTKMEVVDASQLQQAEGVNQNRDRSRETTDLQTQDIVSRFDPELLHEDPSSDRGAPIVGHDNAIDSGNGRVLALNKIYEGYPEQADAYRKMIEGRGFSTEGMERPILIQRRMTDMTPEQRRQFVIDSNKDTKLELSPVERARSDADSITPEMLASYAGGDLNSAANAGFVQAFNKRLTTGEMGGMIGSDRRLTPDGAKRIENAVVAHAYGNPKLLERMMESSNDEIRSITGSLADVAAPWARMREAGDQYDITEQLTDAAARVADARKRDIKPADIVSQQDMLNPMHPVTEELIRAFHNPAMTRSASRKAVTSFLRSYIEQAGKPTQTLFGEEPAKSPVDLLKSLLDDRDNPNGGETMLDAATTKDEANDPHGTPERDESGNARPARQSQEEARDRGKGRARDVAESGDGGRDEGIDEGKPDYSEGIQAGIVEDKSPYDPDFLTASFTNRTSIFNLAAEALGMDPDALTLMPAPRQVALLQRAIKTAFDLDIIVDKGMQERFAIDQMLDAYQNLHGMAHVLDLPARAISLGGTLKVRLQKKGNFLGAFQPDGNLIMLPKRTNSFSHEWGHALDWHLLSLFDEGDAPGRGISGAIRQRGSALEDGQLPTTVREAMVDLLNAMFFDKAAHAQAIMRLEAKIEKTTSPKVKAEAEAQITRLRDGSSQMKGGRTAFYNNAKAFDGAGGDYWQSPTEMMARSFEAYVSYKVEAAGLTAEFIGKGDANYLSDAEERFAKTFPKDKERSAVFAAFENLFGTMGDEELLGKGSAPGKPSGSVRRVTDHDKTPVVTKAKQGFIKREMASIRDALAQKKKEAADRPDDAKGTLEKLNDVRGATLMSMSGELHMIRARTGSRSLGELIDLLTKQDGRGDRTVTRTFAEDVHLRSKRGTNRVNNILTANGIKIIGRPAAEDMLLRDLLIGAREGSDIKALKAELVASGSEGDMVRPEMVAPIVKAAAAIRHILDEEWYENQKAGIDLGYTRNGYLARVLDLPKVYGDQPGFLTKAAEVYKLVFDKEFGKDPDDILADDEARKKFMRTAAMLAKNGHAIPSLGEVRVALRQIAKVARAAAAAAKAGEGDKADALNGQLAQMMSDVGEVFGQLYDEVRPAYAAARAEEWLAQINLHAGEEHNAASPDSKYTKSRTLPQETDKIMEKFFLSDPIESVTNYLNTSARRTAYAKRFGADGAKRKAMFEGMAKEGVSPADQIQVASILDVATGRVRSTLPAAVQGALSALNTAGMMALLPRAVLSSLGEPFTASLVTGNPLDGFKMLGMMLNGALGTPSGRQRWELARAMGIISDAGSNHIMMSRYGQTYADDTRWDHYTAEMFRATGLTRLTTAQKTAGVGLGHAFLDSLAQRVMENGKGRADAIALLRELGVRDPEAFAQQIMAMGRLPSVEELDTPFGHDYTTAQLRFSNMVVQEPGAMDRPLLASNPTGRVLYGITGFSYGYWRNIIKRNGILISEKYKRNKGHAALYSSALFAGAAVAYLVNTIISTIREYFLNPKRWDELDKKGELPAQMAQLGFTRTFSFGAADIPIQTFSGLKYQRDLSNAFVGAAPGFFLQNGQKILTPLVSNSRKTNTAEYNALQGIYSDASPFLAMGLSRIPGAGPAMSIAKGVGMSAVTSPAIRDAFATAIVGKKNEPGKKSPTAYDRMLDNVFGKQVPKKRKGT